TAGGAGAQPAGRRAGARSVTANRSSGVKLAEAAAARDTAARQDGAPSAFGTGPQIVGLEEPQRPTALTYSAPSADGDARPTVRTEGGKGRAAGSGEAAAQAAAASGGNRQARRGAAKAAKERRGPDAGARRWGDGCKKRPPTGFPTRLDDHLHGAPGAPWRAVRFLQLVRGRRACLRRSGLSPSAGTVSAGRTCLRRP